MCALLCVQLSDDVLLRMYTKMVTLDEMDTQLYKVQRMVGIYFHDTHTCMYMYNTHTHTHIYI